MKKQNAYFPRGRIRPRSFFEPLAWNDLTTIFRQMKGRKFDPGRVLGVARRCIYGYPSVIACSPLKNGKPFPTTFWLSCPYLVRFCGELESSGAVAVMEELRKKEKEVWLRYNLLHACLRLSLLSPSQARILRKYRPSLWKTLRLGGVGGVEYRGGGGVKCLHLQAASWLALRFHPAEDFLRETLFPMECRSSVGNGCFCRRKNFTLERSLDHVEGSIYRKHSPGSSEVHTIS